MNRLKDERRIEEINLNSSKLPTLNHDDAAADDEIHVGYIYKYHPILSDNQFRKPLGKKKDFSTSGTQCQDSLLQERKHQWLKLA